MSVSPSPNRNPRPKNITELYGDALIEPAGSPPEGAPNILMLFSDQHHWAYSGFNGHPVVKTPNLDRLSRRGVNFTNAYCNSPLCSPSRQSFMGGMHAHKLGLWNNCAGMPENTVTWAHALSRAGYETLLCGKMHFNGYQKMYGFDRRPVLEANTDGEIFHSYGLRTSHDWTRPLPYRCGKKAPFHGAGPDADERQPIFRHDRRIVEGTIEVIREKGRERPGRPWALCCATILPHPPYKARRDLLERYAGLAELPVNMHGEGLGVVDRAMRAFHWMDGDYAAEDILRMRQAYYGLITEYDEYVGQVLEALEASGQMENTVVFYFSDHGDMAGEHGMVCKCSLREGSAKVAMLASWPGHWPEGKAIETPVSLVDLFPTFLDLAGCRLAPVLAEELDGHSLLPLLEGRPGDFAGGEVFCEFEGEGWNHPRCFLRQGQFKYVYNHTAAHELYDLGEDPQEMDNLIGRPEHAAAERRLRERILGFWDPEAIEKQVLRTQARQKLAYNRNVCKDLGW